MSSFNLVIENLIFSSRCVPQSARYRLRFNLVIENLIFSSGNVPPRDDIQTLFQSRNRESYLFK